MSSDRHSLDKPATSGHEPVMSGAVASILFVLVWSTGFIAARGSLAHADPQLFLLVRMLATAVLVAICGVAARERSIAKQRIALHLAIGTILPGFYLCASWWSVQHGMPAGVMSLLGAIQPLPIALIAWAAFGERLDRRSAIGLATGALGVALVLSPTLERDGIGTATLPAILGLAAVAGMSAATLAQQRLLAGDPLLGACALQNVGGGAIGLIAYALVGANRWDGGVALWLTFAWAVLGLSIGGLVLLAALVRTQGATRVSTLLLLVPALAAVEAWAIFGEALAPIQFAGFGLALGGVLLARRRPPSAAET